MDKRKILFSARIAAGRQNDCCKQLSQTLAIIQQSTEWNGKSIYELLDERRNFVDDKIVV